MKKAFTLIELLVVIAIIAILAAILFPVFAQAKLAAKKTASISNQKQMGLALLMYTNDYDDTYPRYDGCTLNDSIIPSFNVQPAGTNPSPWCNGAPIGGYAFRDNHYDWQKWVEPYIKNDAIFTHPVIQPNATEYAQGEIEGGYALNTAITGAINIHLTTGALAAYGNRVSWLGGTTTSVPSPADAMIIMEQTNSSVLGAYEYGTTSGSIELTYYPLAVKEHWEGYFYQNPGSGPCNSQVGVWDPQSAPFAETVPLSYCDGHTKAIPAGQFMANTPTAAQYGLSVNSYLCEIYDTAAYYGNGQPIVTQGVWPMWGL
ncbi:MAG: prepilin-type N-terminal cleavage/methylation domain-containing protein [Bryobacteraceae bacterium]